MNALTRFVALGLRDADRRVATALAPPALEPTDRYLRDGVVVSAIDRVTARLHAWWTASAAARLSRTLTETVTSEGRARRHQSVAVVVLTAIAVHVALTLLQGPRPGWLWLVIPSMAAVFAWLALATASRSAR